MARIQMKDYTESVAQQSVRAAVQQSIVARAKQLHADVMKKPPRPQSFKRFVDGIEGAPEESVKYNGFISYVYYRLDSVVQFAMEVLYDKSPVGLRSDRPGHPGFYRDNHQLYLNGSAVRNLSGWKPGDEVAIANAVPYSRVIELGGYQGNPSWKVRVPGTDKVYFQAEQIVKRRFGNVANIRFTYRGIGGVGFVGGREGNASDMRYPALVITER